MKCPIDNTNLVITDRQGIEIDYCPECRGVWLDRGELDKIIERSERPVEPRRESQGSYYDHDNKQQGYKRKKRESWFGELFD